MHTVGKRDRGCYASSRKQWLSASGEGKYIWFGSSGTGRILPQMEEAWEKAQRWDEAQVIGSSSKKVFGLLLLASLIAYFFVCEIPLTSFPGSGEFVQEKMLKMCWGEGGESKGRVSWTGWGAWAKGKGRCCGERRWGQAKDKPMQSFRQSSGSWRDHS